MNDLPTISDIKKCPKQYVLAINDALNVLSGKWKLPILASILYGNYRYKDIQNNIENITPRMLSKELKELELNGVIQRDVFDSTPVRIEYKMTESGRNILTVLDAMIEWGITHRESVLKK